MFQRRPLPVPVCDLINYFVFAPLSLNICKDLSAIDVLQLLLLVLLK